MRNTRLGKDLPFEWRLGLGLLIALAVFWAGASNLLIRQDQMMGEAAIRERVQEAKEEAERQREQAARELPRPEQRQEPLPLPKPPPAVGDQLVELDDVAKLRTDPEFRKRALKAAEAEEARRAKDRRPREETPEQREASAALRLKVARRLEAEGFPQKAQARYREIVDQYPETQAAKEAAKALEAMKP
jgi:hypothetical protein